jgi:hypothetical protein
MNHTRFRNQSFKELGAWLGGAIVALWLATTTQAATFTITPSTITNDYVGEVTLTISGLSPGQTITVGVYPDLNGNGTIETNEPLIWSFPLTDGQVPLVGGIRNLNVPGDDDGLANGTIQSVIHIPPDALAFMLGQLNVRITDNLGVFSAVIKPFTVVQRIYPQSITGRVTLAGTGLPVTNAVVTLVNLNNSVNLFAKTDTNGNYTAHCLPGSYGAEVESGSIGVVNNLNQLFSVACGQVVTNNLVLTNGILTISGRVTDSSTGSGIPGLSLDATTTNNLGALTLTDTNGNYSLPVTPGTWSIHPSPDAASQVGYVTVARTKVQVISTNVGGINFALSKATALIYGMVKDSQGHPIVGVQIDARDSGSLYHVNGRSFVTNGGYSLGVLAGTWGPGPNSGDLASRGLTGGAASVGVSAGQAVNIDFTAIRTNLPGLTNPLHVSSSQFQFLLAGLAGQTYTVQAITNLNGTNWLALLTTNIPCSSQNILDGQATNKQKFYRVLVVP